MLFCFRHYAPGEEWEDDPLLVEFMKMDRDRQNPTADIHSMLLSLLFTFSISCGLVVIGTC